jgi:hypothetical protein
LDAIQTNQFGAVRQALDAANPQPAMPCAGEPEFKAVEKELKTLWLR